MEEEPEEPSLLLKIARHWRTAGVRIVFIGAFLILWFMVCCGIVHLACKFWCKSLCDSCSCCCSPGVKQCCQYLYSDPMYEKVKELGDMFGIKISYAMYEKIKDHYIDDSQLNEITNPLGIF
ncbi:hypothetical protein BaRGS_00027817 [Batillaria attramentaria]|uniref:Uncharacterized protein n=1 Tax=Batillaria attramentaria TaxID=370345 RepID=A0ABD0K0M7_9CAEN